jgi:hypothetical protein
MQMSTARSPVSSVDTNAPPSYSASIGFDAPLHRTRPLSHLHHTLRPHSRCPGEETPANKRAHPPRR